MTPGHDILTKKDKKLINQDLNDIMQFKHQPSTSESKVSEDDTNEFLLTDVDKLDSNIIPKHKSTSKLELKDIQETNYNTNANNYK